jgi:hypothetical protein
MVKLLEFIIALISLVTEMNAKRCPLKLRRLQRITWRYKKLCLNQRKLLLALLGVGRDITILQKYRAII